MGNATIDAVCEAHKETEGQLAPMWDCSGCKLRKATATLASEARRLVVIPLDAFPRCCKFGCEEPATSSYRSCNFCDVHRGYGLVGTDHWWAPYLRALRRPTSKATP